MSQSSIKPQPTRPDDPLIPIQPRGKARPLFCAPPIGGSAFCYLALARHLGDDQPFYAFQSRGIDSDTAPLRRIEDMAAYYVKSLRQVSPEGPYLLGGWSLGGVIAFEMAHQLRAQGHEIGLLMLIDPCSLESRPEQWEPRKRVLRFFQYLNLGGDLPAADDLPNELAVDDLFAHVLDQIRSANPALARADLPYLQKLFNIFQANAEAERSYVPQRWSGVATLILAEVLERATAASETRWRQWIETADVHAVPGDHFTMLKAPHVAVLGKRIAESLTAAG
jgi:thioesterase domain-containing protein